jgi:membrane associated rhomboid family serine protease
MVTRLIIVNAAIFVAVNVLKIVLKIANQWETPEFYTDFIQFFCMAADWKQLLTHPWGILTSIFLHEDFMHILFNMLFLYWFGRIVGDLIGNKHILPIYILGGIVGNIVYFITANLLNYGGSFALGASAGTTAILLAAGFLAPDYWIGILLIGPVRLKYVVAVVLFLDLIAIANDSNTGGHFAHLGGAIMGALYISRLRAGQDLGAPIVAVTNATGRFFDNLLGQRKGTWRPKVAYKSPGATKQKQTRPSRPKSGVHVSDAEDLSHQEKLDSILDKIKQSGYDSLSNSEKEFLFNASKK